MLLATVAIVFAVLILLSMPIVFALGVAGMTALHDLRGSHDAVGYELRSTLIAVADEIAGAAELVMGKDRGVPAAIIRGVDVVGDGSARDLVMPRDRDLFS